MISRIVAACLLAAGLAACGTPAKIDHMADPAVKPAESSGSIDLRRIVSKQEAGEHVGQLRAGLACAGQGDLTARGINVDITDREIIRVVYDEFKAANYNMAGTPDDLFDNPEREKADYQLAGVVSNVKSNICFPFAGLGNVRSSRGEYGLTVDWQLYSRQRGAVVYSLTTNGTAKLEDSVPDGFRVLQQNALRQATKNLLVDEGFRSAVARRSAPPAPRPGS